MIKLPVKLAMIFLLAVGCGGDDAYIDSYLKSLYKLPEIKNGKPDHQIYSETVEALGIGRLDTAVTEPQIRIWYEYGENSKVLVIVRRKDQWKGTLLQYNYSRDSAGRHHITGTTARDVSPRSGWTSFLKDLLKYEIATLPDLGEGGNFVQADGRVYIVEFAQPAFYRIYSYKSPCAGAPGSDEAYALCSILELVHEELGIE